MTLRSIALLLTLAVPVAAGAHEAAVDTLMTKALEGSIVMQLGGGEETTLTAGQTLYEGPADVHTVGRNASATAPARFLVVFLKNQGAGILEPVN